MPRENVPVTQIFMLGSLLELETRCKDKFSTSDLQFLGGQVKKVNCLALLSHRLAFRLLDNSIELYLFLSILLWIKN